MSTSEGVLDLRELNAQMAGMNAEERVRLACGLFGGDLVLATSFGPTSGVMFSLMQTVNPHIRVITVRHGYETPDMLEFARRQQQLWGLDVRVYEGESLPVPSEESSAFAEFQYRVKVMPFRDALRREKARAWLSGVMRDESPARKDFDYVMMQNGLPVVYPILDWSDERAAEYVLEHDIPKLSSYYDPTKGAGQNRECGLHRGPNGTR